MNYLDHKDDLCDYGFWDMELMYLCKYINHNTWPNWQLVKCTLPTRQRVLCLIYTVKCAVPEIIQAKYILPQKCTLPVTYTLYYCIIKFQRPLIKFGIIHINPTILYNKHIKQRLLYSTINIMTRPTILGES